MSVEVDCERTASGQQDLCFTHVSSTMAPVESPPRSIPVRKSDYSQHYIWDILFKLNTIFAQISFNLGAYCSFSTYLDEIFTVSSKIKNFS